MLLHTSKTSLFKEVATLRIPLEIICAAWLNFLTYKDTNDCSTFNENAVRA